MNSDVPGTETDLDWDGIKSELFSLTNIANRVNADKLFVSFLMALEKRGVDRKKRFTIREVVEFIPKGTAGVTNYSTYGFSITSMLIGEF
ncbi:hypothetical protein LIT32_25935 (plasmid) [Bacillus sp. CMF21]|nr:hypothetical protein LIT32_25935 [Bacillus sp. CMF21]